MDGALKVLLLAALTLLVSAQTFTDYHSLPDEIRKHIDKALDKTKKDYGPVHHVAFHNIIGTPLTMQSNLYINVHLKVRNCEKGPGKDNTCAPEPKIKYMIDCLVCTTKENKEQLDCSKKIELKSRKRMEIRSNCRDYLHGGLTSFLKTEGKQKQTGCPGCV